MSFMRSIHGAWVAFCLGSLGLLAACDSAAPACNPALDPGGCVKAPECSGTRRDCKNGGLDGCETDVSSDLKNCGACGNTCPTPATGQAVCSDGVCGVATCGDRYRDCNGDPSDGCETDTQRNIDSCGRCGNRCATGAHAAAACSLGQCKLACQAGYLDCDGQSANGCETNGASDINHCGSCGNRCTSSGAANAVCAGGTCEVSSCSAPFLTCRSGATNACETDSSRDLSHCGRCGRACGAVSNGTPSCQDKNCAIGSCNEGYADCNQDLSDGCEAGISGDPAHCGSCAPCPGYGLVTSETSCTSRVCDLTCRAEYYDVNRDPSDGCEAPDDFPPGHYPGNPTGDRGSKPCEDGASGDAMYGKIVSDARVHKNPDVFGYVPSVGAAPDYWFVTGTGGAFCANDIAFTFTTTGGNPGTPCYYFLVETDKYSDGVILSGSQIASLSYGGVFTPAYTSGSRITISVQKICSTMTLESVTYLIQYHL